MDTGGYSGDKRFDMVKVPGIRYIKMGMFMHGVPYVGYTNAHLWPDDHPCLFCLPDNSVAWPWHIYAHIKSYSYIWQPRNQSLLCLHHTEMFWQFISWLASKQNTTRPDPCPLKRPIPHPRPFTYQSYHSPSFYALKPFFRRLHLQLMSQQSTHPIFA